MLSGTYSRETSNPGLASAGPDTLSPVPPRLDAGLGRRAELAFCLAVVVVTSGAVWSLGSWLLTSWQLH
ncbi:MAG TPA: hypothetical protein VFZ61_26520 [Polyangiales bacterium]